MKETILSHYRGVYQQGFWLLGIGALGLGLGYLAYSLWGMVGQGIFIVTIIFGSIQLWMGLIAILSAKRKPDHKLQFFEKDRIHFISEEIKHLTSKEAQYEPLKNFLTVLFLAGLLCLFISAFGKGPELMLGIGAALAAEGAIQLILSLLTNYRDSFYLLRLIKYKKAPDSFD